jgi:TatD DNase family protein
MIDTHAHMCDAAFDPDLEEVLRRGRQAGLAGVISVGETLEDAHRNLEISRLHPEIYPAAGLYPTYLDLSTASALEEWIRRHRRELVAIGEVGLDHWKIRDPRDREIQKEIFLQFITLSKELDLPLNVHSRSAGRHVIEHLVANGADRVQLHAFDGKPARAMPAVEAGFYFSIPPSIIRSRQKQKLVRQLPLECLLVETDSPVLGPEPGVRNEPANTGLALEAVAELKERPLQEVAEAVEENTRRLYGI